LADSLVGVEDVTSHEGELVALVVVLVVLLGRHSRGVSDKLFKSASLAQVFNQLGVLRTDLVDHALFLKQEFFESVAAFLLEDLGDLTLGNTVGIALRKDVVQHVAHSSFIVF